jgi:catechol 2,3-dioxygenase-like lactoylglutathione lyase family enzyme
MNASLEGLTLHVADVERSRAFYECLPGAVLVNHRPGQFALLQIGRTRLGLLTSRFLPPGAPGFHLEISTGASGVDALYDAVRAAGLEPEGSPTNRSWGERTFHVTDPDGNLIEFDSRLGDAGQS